MLFGRRCHWGPVRVSLRSPETTMAAAGNTTPETRGFNKDCSALLQKSKPRAPPPFVKVGNSTAQYQCQC